MKTASVGLIAVSGVRVCNERLIRLGVTLPGFVERARVIASMPSLGLLTLAGVTPDDYDITYLAVREGVVHPTINYQTPDPACDLDYVPNESRRLAVELALVNAFAFGGHCISLAVQAVSVN